MGQAKRRGTFDQRLSTALAVQEAEAKVLINLAAKHHMPKAKVRKRLGLMLVRALATGGFLSRLQSQHEQPTPQP